jgi:hypothetical protein
MAAGPEAKPVARRLLLPVQPDHAKRMPRSGGNGKGAAAGTGWRRTEWWACDGFAPFGARPAYPAVDAYQAHWIARRGPIPALALASRLASQRALASGGRFLTDARV